MLDLISVLIFPHLSPGPYRTKIMSLEWVNASKSIECVVFEGIVHPVPETFGDYISKFSQFGGYISKFGQINLNPVTKYSQILTIFRDLTKFRNIVTKSFGHWTHSTMRTELYVQEVVTRFI